MWWVFVIVHSLYYISPAYIANGFAVFGGGKPIDGGRKWRGKRIFGDGKTWKGLFIGTLAGSIIGLFWYYLSQSPPLNQVYFNTFDFRIIDPLFGFYLGFGALFGDIVKSFLKRRVGIKRGDPWFGFDQLDLVAGSLVFAYLFAPTFLILEEIMALAILTITIHFIGNRIAFESKFKKVPW